MHCPNCGGTLKQEVNPAFAAHKRAMNAWDYEGDPPELADASAHYRCDSTICTLHGVLLRECHPLRGPYSQSGDSFSLAMVEGPMLTQFRCTRCGQLLEHESPDMSITHDWDVTRMVWTCANSACDLSGDRLDIHDAVEGPDDPCRTSWAISWLT